VAVRERVSAAWNALRGTVADVVERAAYPVNIPAFMQTYGEPNAERVLQSFDQFAELAFGGNAVVFGVVNTRAKLFAEARFKWRRLNDKALWGSPELSKLERPWPNGTTGEMLTRMEQDASLAGNAYVRDCGNRLERLRPDWVTIVSLVTDDDFGHQVREVVGYIYDPIGDTDRGIEFYPVEEVAHWSPIPDPLANFRGMSWLTPVLKEINADKAMTEHREKFFRNAATPNMIIKYASKMTPEQKRGLADSIAARHGGPENSGGTLVLDEGADPMIVGSAFRDAQFDELQAAGENRIAVAGGVPAMVVGLKEGLDAAAWSMYRQAMRALADLTMRPNWRGACAALSVLVDVPTGSELWFDTTDIAALQEGENEAAITMQTQASTASTLISAGFEPTSVVTAITAGDMTLLKHTGLVSVQLLPPGKADTPPSAQPPGVTPPTTTDTNPAGG
jgi:phage portal protein BeeE